MPSRAIAEDASPLVSPRRSAHASIRGYLYQAHLSVLRWLQLHPNEVLLCEGDEDIDRLVRGGGVSEQVKAVAGQLPPRTLRAVIASFVHSYTVLRQRQTDRRFLLTTTAAGPKWLLDGGADVLVLWSDSRERTLQWEAIASAIKTFLADAATGETSVRGTSAVDLAAGLTWLNMAEDGGRVRWRDFIEAVEWQFGAPDIEQTRRQIVATLTSLPEARLLPQALLVDRLLWEVLEASCQPEPQARTLDGDDLTRLFATSGRDLALWQETAGAKALADALALDRLLRPGTLQLDPAQNVLDKSPGQLVMAQYEVVPFSPELRTAELETLNAWCDDEQPVSVRLWFAEGGMGKTRLFIEAGHQRRDRRWHAGFLPYDDLAKEDAWESVALATAPRLVVIDYCESRPAQVANFLKYIAGRAPLGQLRIALLARRPGNWFKHLASEQDEALRWLIDRSMASFPTVELSPVSVDPEKRRQIVGHAREYLAKRAGRPAMPLPRSLDLSDELFRRPLYLHMKALLLILGGEDALAQDVLHQVLIHEQRFWWNKLDADTSIPGVASYDEALQRHLRRALASHTLLGGTDDPDRLRALVTVALGPGAPEAHITACSAVIERVYGVHGEQSDTYGPVEPDLLGEQLIQEAFQETPSLLKRVILHATHGQRAKALAFLTRLSRRRQREAPAQTDWLVSAVIELARPTVDAVIAQESEALQVASVLADALLLLPADSVEVLRVAEDVVRTCDAPANQRLVTLREIAAAATTVVANRMRAEGNSEELARTLSNLGVRSSDLGRREEALGAAEEATELNRQLADARPDAFLPDLAMSLGNLGERLNENERPSDACDAFEQAVRALARHFLALPQGYASRMRYMVDDYVRVSVSLNRDVDEVLLQPIRAAL